MSSYTEKTNKLIDEIVQITEKGQKVKPLIRKLGDHLADGIKNKRPEAMNLAKIVQEEGSRGTEEITERMVLRIIIRFKDKYFSSVSQRWIRKCLPDEYKEERAEQEKKKTEPKLKLEDISDADIVRLAPEVTRKFRKLTSSGPAKPFKIRNPEDLVKDTSGFPLKDIWIKIYENMVNDYESGKLSPEIIKALERRFKSLADRRFAVSEMKYEAIILAVNTVDTLNNATKDETQILDRWDMFDRERECLKCENDLFSCRAEKCKCACHESVKRLTPKGLQWAIDHSDHLKTLDDGIKKFSEWKDDICAIGRVILVNPMTRKFLNMKEAKEAMANHIANTKCDQCELYIEENPDFFREFSSKKKKE